MNPVGFEPTISVGELPQTHALDGAATGTGLFVRYWVHNAYLKKHNLKNKTFKLKYFCLQ
jgi:hypothetical protein